MISRLLFHVPFLVVLGLLATGCGSSAKIPARGRVMKDGAPLLMSEGDFLRVTFVPIPEGTERVTDFYVANVSSRDGTFQAAGKDLKGVPPGKYRIAVEHLRNKRDLLRGAFDAEHSPFVRDINRETSELVLDLAKPQGS